MSIESAQSITFNSLTAIPDDVELDNLIDFHLGPDRKSSTIGLNLPVKSDIHKSLMVTFDAFFDANPLEFNTLTGEIFYKGKPFDIETAHFEVVAEIARLMESKRGYSFSNLDSSLGLFTKTALRHAKKNPFDPIKQYLENLQPSDGKAFEQFVSILNLNPTDAKRMRKFLISTIARRYNPGCEISPMPVFVGPTATGKTAFFKTIFDIDNQSLAYVKGDKDFSKEGIRKHKKSWVTVFDEAVAFQGKRSFEKTKAVLTQTEDVLRDLYCNTPITYPRGYCFACTTNAIDWIPQEEAVARRMFIIEIPKLYDFKALAAIRDNLLAELRDAYLAGESFTFNPTDIRELIEDTLGKREQSADEVRLEVLIDTIASKLTLLPTFELVKISKDIGIFRGEHNQEKRIKDVTAAYIKSKGVKTHNKQIRLGGKKVRCYVLSSCPDDLTEESEKYSLVDLEAKYHDYRRESAASPID